jgi:hypothetical protein
MEGEASSAQAGATVNANAPRLECDLVMKGGITSGVIYPRLVSKLPKTYNFRSIGGTSARAIAAGAAAAAQFGVLSGARPDAFEELDRLPCFQRRVHGACACADAEAKAVSESDQPHSALWVTPACV